MSFACSREWQEKVDLVDHPEDDTIEYAFKNTYIFDQTKSEGLTGEEELILPHTFILALAMTVVREKPAMLPIIGLIYKNVAITGLDTRVGFFFFHNLCSEGATD